ncbi:MAG: GspE/PulE family protein [Candidatus Omnitrophica bacterium]|nr:GspE/PulE family protein [Candidatus Omnitrophota bacterium]
MAKTIKEKVLEALAQLHHISGKDVEGAVAWHKEKGISLEKAFIEKGLISEEELLNLLVKELNIPMINLAKYKIDPSLKEIVDERVARQYHLLPISKIGNTITVVLSDPFNIFTIDDLKALTNRNVDVVLSESTKITTALDEYYGIKDANSIGEISRDIDIKDFHVIDDKGSQGFTEINIAETAGAAPIVRMVDLIIKEALKQRASDIHVEPQEDHARIRYRTDGVLHEVLNIPKINQSAVIVRLKIMAGADITETQSPQDGRFKMRIGTQEIDFRVSLLPTTFGQKVVIRILDKTNLSTGLDGLNFSSGSAQKLKDAVARPFGMILVTGPTGSGKSTTLYSIISQLNTVEKNIITIEDPVEYLIDGLTQIPARPEIGLTFAAGLRAILRQSPDVVMLGEIRDSETSDIAIKASLTGQLVLSTLHTNDAAGALTRLVDMGVEPFLVASSVIAICAQRLCRTICPKCKESVEFPEEALERFKNKIKPGMKFFVGKGCDFCRKSGYYGRSGILEVLEVDEPIREMLIKGTSSSVIKEYAMKKGMTTLWDDAVEKLISGTTTVEEVLRVTSEDEN